MAGHRPFWWITAPVAGVLAGLSLPPLGVPPLLWLALVVLWAQGPRAAALWGGAAVLVSHRWLLWLHPLDWVGVPLPLSLPLCVALLLAIALLAAVLVALWRWVVERLGPERWATALLASALWGLAEVWLAKGPLFWLGLGSVALPGDRALAGLAQLVGAGGLAALQLLLAWGLWRVLALATAAQRGWWRAASAWLLLVVALHGLGWQLLRLPAEPAGPIPLLVLQPAIPTRRKFELREQLLLLDRLVTAQRQAALLKASAVLLPEGALALGQALPEPAAVEVLSGGFRQPDEGQRSALLRFAPGSLQPDGWLEKHRLVPLGEWIPLAELWRWSGLSAVGGLTPGDPSRLLQRPGGAIGVAICYELSDGSALAAASRDGAQWLLANANLDPYPPLLQHQFAALAQLRAIESGRWLVSAANTGPSLVVDASGQVRRQLPAGRPATALLELHPRTQITGYARWGELPLVWLALLGAIAALQRPRRA